MLFLWEMISFSFFPTDYCLTSSSLIDFLLVWICYCFCLNLKYRSKYVYGCFYKKWFPCMNLKYLFSYVTFIDWYSKCLDLYVVVFHLNYCSWYDCGCLPRSDCLLWLWNDYYLISSQLIDYLLALICLLFLFIWLIIARMFVAVYTRNDCFVCLWNYLYLISSSLIDSLLA